MALRTDYDIIIKLLKNKQYTLIYTEHKEYNYHINYNF